MRDQKIADLASRIGSIALDSGLEPFEMMKAIALTQELMSSFLELKYRTERKSPEEFAQSFMSLIEDAVNGER